MDEQQPLSKLRPCRDCGQQMSPKAWVCPGCGSPNTAKYLRMLIYALVLLVVLYTFDVELPM